MQATHHHVVRVRDFRLKLKFSTLVVTLVYQKTQNKTKKSFKLKKRGNKSRQCVRKQQVRRTQSPQGTAGCLRQADRAHPTQRSVLHSLWRPRGLSSLPLPRPTYSTSDTPRVPSPHVTKANPLFKPCGHLFAAGLPREQQCRRLGGQWGLLHPQCLAHGPGPSAQAD